MGRAVTPATALERDAASDSLTDTHRTAEVPTQTGSVEPVHYGD